MSCGCKDHNHAGDALAERGEEYSLFKHIAIDSVTCLNERVPASGKNVFKSFDQRRDNTKFLESNEDDTEFILHIPFTGVAKIKSIVIIGGEDGTHPNKMKAFVNRDDIDFGIVNDVKAAQEWDLHEDFKGEIEYTTSHLTLFFPTNFGADSSRLYYVGLKGEFNEMKRQAVHAVYESRPQASDHKQDSGANALSRTLGQ